MTDRVLSPAAISEMDTIKAQHLVIKAGLALLSNQETRDLGLALFTVAAWLIPEDQPGEPVETAVSAGS